MALQVCEVYDKQDLKCFMLHLKNTGFKEAFQIQRHSRRFKGNQAYTLYYS